MKNFQNEKMTKRKTRAETRAEEKRLRIDAEFHRLPDLVLTKIITKLDNEDLSNLSLASKGWYNRLNNLSLKNRLGCPLCQNSRTFLRFFSDSLFFESQIDVMSITQRIKISPDFFTWTPYNSSLWSDRVKSETSDYWPSYESVWQNLVKNVSLNFSRFGQALQLFRGISQRPKKSDLGYELKFSSRFSVDF